MKNIIKLNKKQKGISLPISLFVLIGVMLSALILIRTGDVSVTVAGNLGSKVQIGGSNDQVINSAFKWLKDNVASLDNDDYANGYFSSMSFSYIDYANDSYWLNAKTLPPDAAGNVSSFKIMRMCAIPNAARNEIVGGVNNFCYIDGAPPVVANTSSVGYAGYEYTQESPTVAILYKVVVKTVGPKNATTITESLVSI